MGEQKRHWMLTVFEKHFRKFDDLPHDIFELPLESTFAACKKVRYACGQLEKCPTTGTLHHQIYVEFNESLRLSQVVKLFPSNAEPRLGTRTDARDYCTSEKYNGKDKGKIGNHWEVGTWRADLEGRTKSQKARIITYICTEGLEPADIAKQDPEAYFSHWRSIQALWAAYNDKFIVREP